MATQLSITTGPLSAVLNYTNDTKAQAALLAFYTAYDLGPSTATNQEKLQAILNWIALFVREKAIQYYLEQQRAATAAEGGDLYDLGGIEPTTE